MVSLFRNPFNVFSMIFFSHLFCNLFVDICVIEFIKTCVLSNLIIKGNNHISALKKSYTGLTVDYESKRCIRYTNNICHLGAVCIRLLQKYHKLAVWQHCSCCIVLEKIHNILRDADTKTSLFNIKTLCQYTAELK